MVDETNRAVSEEKLALLRQRFASALPDRIAALQVALHDAEAGAPLTDLERLLHRLAGSAGSYGFPAISFIALEAENQCRNESLPRHRRLAAVSGTLERLQTYVLPGTADAR